MLASINPVVYRGSKRRLTECISAHLTGGAFGGAVLIGGLSLITTPFRHPHAALSFALAAALALAALAYDTGVFPWRPPSPNKQVPESWRRRFRPQVAAFAYGFGLGLAVTTRVRFALTYALVVDCIILLSSPAAIICGVIFGTSRSAVVLLGIGADTREQVNGRLGRLGAAERTVQVVVLFASAALVVGLASLTWRATASS